MITETEKHICQLISYGTDHHLIEDADGYYCANQIANMLNISLSQDFVVEYISYNNLDEILDQLVLTGIDNHIITDSTIDKDILDTKLMGILTPMPSIVNHTFSFVYKTSAEKATQWFYTMQKDVNYIRSSRIAKNRSWLYESEYGTMEITINLSKPELDPKSIAVMKHAQSNSYPYDLLCEQNVGFAGNAMHPSRMNLRQLPLTLGNEPWLMQYSPYAYFDQHCIILTKNRREMKISRQTFTCLCDFSDIFPHYMIGSNSDLPISGGSILSHEHFQGGMHEFAMNRAPIIKEVFFKGYEKVTAGIVNWPMSVLRLSSKNRNELICLCNEILQAWLCYSDEENMIYAYKDGERHNTVTPILHRKDDTYIMELVFRNNLTTKEYPLGYFHPHPALHHIKKENIGLIEVMGLAILPGRLQKEINAVKAAILNHSDINSDDLCAPHANWVSSWLYQYEDISEDNIDEILQKEIGKVFVQVLKDCGVFKTIQAFDRFLEHVNKRMNCQR